MKYVVSITSLFLFSYVCYGLSDKQPNNKPLTLKLLIDEVEARNPDLAAARDRVHAATFVIDRVQAPSDPQFTWATDFNNFGSPTNDMFPENRYELAQTFPFPGKLQLKGKIAKQQLAFARSEKTTTLKELILQSKKLYFQLSLNYLARNINKKNRAIVSDFFKDALALYKTGKGTQENVFKARIEYEMLKNELFVLQSEFTSIKAMINALINRPQSEHIGKPDEFFHQKLNLSLHSLTNLAMRKRSELRGITSMVEEQRTISKLAKLEVFPDITVSGMIHDMKNSPHHGWGINVSFNIPLFYSQRQRRESQEAHAKAIAYQNTFVGLSAMIGGQIKELLAKIQSTEKRIKIYEKKILPTTIKTLYASQARYRTGKGDFLFLLDTRRQLQNFQLSYDQVRIDREILLAELERAIGVPLEKTQHLSRNYDE